ncbi:MAG TPA: FAD:protein FMN transferase [Acidobacteriota bacterium]|jgi:thiamine biosynthesis lipoprotein
MAVGKCVSRYYRYLFAALPISLLSTISLFAEYRTRAEYVMGTLMEITLEAPAAAHAELFAQAFGEARRLDGIFSLYKPASDLSRLNAKSGLTVNVAPEIIELSQISMDLFLKTDGAFDPSILPLIDCWKKSAAAGKRPSRESLRAALARIGMERVSAALPPRAGGPTAPIGSPGFQLPAGMRLTFDGIAKGYAVDRVAAVLKGRGVGSGFVNLGESSQYAWGNSPSGGPWKVALRDPADPNQLVATLVLQDQGLSTSGSYEQFIKIGNRRVSHIFDPQNGMPVRADAAATVVCRSATLADAYSTAVLVLHSRGVRTFHHLTIEWVLVDGRGAARRVFKSANLPLSSASLATIGSGR